MFICIYNITKVHIEKYTWENRQQNSVLKKQSIKILSSTEIYYNTSNFNNSTQMHTQTTDKWKWQIIDPEMCIERIQNLAHNKNWLLKLVGKRSLLNKWSQNSWLVIRKYIHIHMKLYPYLTILNQNKFQMHQIFNKLNMKKLNCINTKRTYGRIILCLGMKNDSLSKNC